MATGVGSANAGKLHAWGGGMGAQVRFSASSSACFAFNPLRYSNSNGLFTSLRKAWLNPARRSPITLSVATLFLPIAIEKGGISFPIPEIP
jgi:hypothetical protein